jgi:hypothetical protein
MELLNFDPGSDSETCHDGNQDVSVKVEDVTDMQEVEQPLQVTSPLIKPEQDVRPCIQCLRNFSDIQIAYFLTHLCLSIFSKLQEIIYLLVIALSLQKHYLFYAGQNGINENVFHSM